MAGGKGKINEYNATLTPEQRKANAKKAAQAPRCKPKTIDVMRCVDEDVGYYQHTKQDKIGQAAFYVIPWDRMKRAGYNVLIYNGD